MSLLISTPASLISYTIHQTNHKSQTHPASRCPGYYRKQPRFVFSSFNGKLPRFVVSSLNGKLPRFVVSSLNGKLLKHGGRGKLGGLVAAKKTENETVFEDKTLSFDLEDQGELEDEGSPWEGAIIYKRNAYVSHVEHCTTLERLGLGSLSTNVSKAKASNMGLRITKAVNDYPSGTPVQVSIDVTRKIQKLRLDGIIKTVLTLGCNRCGEAAAESIFSNFSLILSENPIEEPDVITFRMPTAEGNFSTSASTSSDQEMEDEDALVDLDDWLYFPREEKEIDISKHIRDLVHIEIKITAICDPNCKGLCLKCGANLNKEKCECGKQKKEDAGYGPLGNLRSAL